MEPCSNDGAHIRGERRASPLSIRAHAPYVGAGAEFDRVPVEADQLAKARSGLGGALQQGVVAAAEPRRPVRYGEDRFDLGARQEVHLSLVMLIARNREDALDESAASGLFERRKPEERPNCGQAQIARSDPGAAPRLEIDQERADEGRIQISERRRQRSAVGTAAPART